MKLCAVIVCVLASRALSQGVALEISPDPLPAGGTLSVVLTESVGRTITFLSSCVFTTVHAGMPNGPVVGGNICAGVLTSVPANGTLSQAWTAPGSLGPGLYYLKVTYRPVGPPITEWFPFTIEDPAQPLLSAATNAQVGQPLVMGLTDSASAGLPYVCAASLTTNQGLPLGPGLFCSLDMDFVFDLSFPAPLFPLFTGFQGSLDASGGAGLSVQFPNAASLTYLPFHVQGAVLSPTGAAVMTNPLSFTIMP